MCHVLDVTYVKKGILCLVNSCVVLLESEKNHMGILCMSQLLFDLCHYLISPKEPDQQEKHIISVFEIRGKSHYRGKKGRTIYVAPYCDRM